MAFPRILSDWRSGVAGFTALAMTAAPSFAENAKPTISSDQSQPEVVHVAQTEEAILAAIQKVNVPYRDARENSRDAVQFMAAALSEGAQTIVLYQPTNDIWDATMDGARRAIVTSETSLNGVLLAAGEEREIAFYANSQLTATILNPDPETLSEDIQAQLATDYETYIRPLGLAMGSSDTPTLEADG